MIEITPNHLLSLNDVIGLKLVDSNEHVPGSITKSEIADLAAREGYSVVRYLDENTPMVTADLREDRIRVFIDETGIILDVYSV